MKFSVRAHCHPAQCIKYIKANIIRMKGQLRMFSNPFSLPSYCYVSNKVQSDRQTYVEHS
jgi:hypothetical protein